MAKDIEEGETSQPIITATSSSSNTSGTNPKIKAKPDPVLATCRCFSFVTVMASVLCIIVNVLSAIRSFKNVSDVRRWSISLSLHAGSKTFLAKIAVILCFLQIFDGIFRCYAVIIAVIVIVGETEWTFIIKFWKVVSNLDFRFTCLQSIWNTVYILDGNIIPCYFSINIKGYVAWFLSLLCANSGSRTKNHYMNS